VKSSDACEAHSPLLGTFSCCRASLGSSTLLNVRNWYSWDQKRIGLAKMSMFGLNLFGDHTPRLTPEENAKNWKKLLKKEMREMDRGVTRLTTAEKNAIKECKKLAKNGNPAAAKLLAREVVNIRKAKNRMHASKAQLNSVVMSLQLSISNLKVQGCLSKSTDIMAAMGSLMKLPELQESMTSMAREMEKAGLVDEIIQDTFEMAEPDIDIEADAEVSKIMNEITSGIFTKESDVATNKPIVKEKAPGTATAADGEKEEEGEEGEGLDEEEMAAIQSRLQTL
jgi:charged multivesicular body protein 3